MERLFDSYYQETGREVLLEEQYFLVIWVVWTEAGLSEATRLSLLVSQPSLYLVTTVPGEGLLSSLQ